MQSEEDEVQEEDIEAMQRNLNRSSFTIFPDSNFKQLWDIVSAVLITFLAIYKPFEVIFNLEIDQTLFTRILLSVDTFVQFWFIIDILLYLNTGFFDKG